MSSHSMEQALNPWSGIIHEVGATDVAVCAVEDANGESALPYNFVCISQLSC